MALIVSGFTAFIKSANVWIFITNSFLLSSLFAIDFGIIWKFFIEPIVIILTEMLIFSVNPRVFRIIPVIFMGLYT